MRVRNRAQKEQEAYNIENRDLERSRMRPVSKRGEWREARDVPGRGWARRGSCGGWGSWGQWGDEERKEEG